MAAGKLTDEEWMTRALALAAHGQGFVEPNPMVGCILVSQGELIGAGHHAKFGGLHAERAALEDVKRRGHSSRLAGATAYVTLEPCCHFGKTPPCTDALLEAKLGRVVMAMLDPFPQVAGQGLARLQHANIQTLVGVQELAAQELNAPYLKRILQKTPWVIAKWAMSLDGRIATRTGHSQWISNEQSRQYVQQLRGRVDAVLVGIGTALADNPRLTPRTEAPPPRIPLRVVIDSQARLPATSQLATTANQSPVLIWSGPNANGDNVQRLRSQGCELVISSDGEPNQRLHTLLQTLVKDYGVTNLLVEGGGAILGSLLELKQIDECEVFIAPKLIGGSQAYAPIAGLGIDQLTDGPQVASHAVATLGDDVHVRCRFNWNRKP